MSKEEPQKLSYKRTPVELPTFYGSMMRHFAYANVSMRDVSLLIFGDIHAIEKLIENKDDKLTPIEKSVLLGQIKIAIEGITITRKRVFLSAVSEEQRNLYGEIKDDSWI